MTNVSHARQTLNPDFCYVDETSKGDLCVRANSKATELAYLQVVANAFVPKDVASLDNAMHHMDGAFQAQAAMFERKILNKLRSFDETCKSLIMECYTTRPYLTTRDKAIYLNFIINQSPLHATLDNYAGLV